MKIFVRHTSVQPKRFFNFIARLFEMPLTVHKPIENFFIASALFLLVFFFFGGIFYMANLRTDLGTGIALFLGWFAFLGVWLSALIPPIRWIDSDAEYGGKGCHCSSNGQPSV